MRLGNERSVSFGGFFDLYTLAAGFQFCTRRRQAHCIAAGSVFDIAADVISGLGEAYFLNEGNSLFEVAYLHAEHLVKLLHLLAAGFQRSNGLGTLHAVCMESG